jgi:small subunit ribosomal protein S2
MGKYLALLAGIVFGLSGTLLFIWLLWLLWRRLEEEPTAPAIEIKPEPPPAVKLPDEGLAPEEVPVEPPPPPKADDLKRIEGIGPKIASVLQGAGISTFAHLAETSVEQLRQILQDADPRLIRLADPTTWPEQAKLAAAGEWDAFGALLDELKGGRRA